MGLYEVLVYTQCISHSRWRLACPQFGEAERSTSNKVKQCIAVNRTSSRTNCSHLKKVTPKNQLDCMQTAFFDEIPKKRLSDGKIKPGKRSKYRMIQ